MKTRTFIDQVDVIVRSGKGGDGSASFRREALVAFGGPDGGDGGRGGDVVLRGSTHVNSLISLYFDPKLYAEDGVPGSGKRCFGRRGKDLVVDVPCGTLATDADTGLVVADIVSPGQRVVVAKGGSWWRTSYRPASASSSRRAARAATATCISRAPSTRPPPNTRPAVRPRSCVSTSS